jgi:hypothetical protein
VWLIQGQTDRGRRQEIRQRVCVIIGITRHCNIRQIIARDIITLRGLVSKWIDILMNL